VLCRRQLRKLTNDFGISNSAPMLEPCRCERNSTAAGLRRSFVITVRCQVKMWAASSASLNVMTVSRSGAIKLSAMMAPFS
jgi:hypothetical protein